MDIRSFFAPVQSKAKREPPEDAPKEEADPLDAVKTESEPLDTPTTAESEEPDELNTDSDQVKGLSYVEQWDTVVDSFSELNPDNERHLLNTNERGIIDTFTKLTTNARLMFVRIMMRKHKVERVNKLVFADEASMNELADAGLISMDPVESLTGMLNLLSRDELMPLAKLFRVPRASSLSVPQLNAALENAHATSSRSFSFDNFSESTNSILLDRVKAILGRTLLVSATVVDLFRTLFFVYNREKHWTDNPFLVHVRANLRVRRLHYEQFPVRKCTLTWPTRDDLVEFIRMCKLQIEIESLVQSVTGMKVEADRQLVWQQVVALAEPCMQVFTQWRQDFPEDGHVSGIPWLASFTGGMKSTSILKHLASAYKHLNLLQQASDLYATLLSHKITGLKRGRGKMWEEYLLLLTKQGRVEEAHTKGLDALADNALEFGARRSVEARLLRLSNMKNATVKMARHKFAPLDLNLSTRRLESCFARKVVAKKTFSATGRKALYSCINSGEDCHVEQLALNEYERLGFKGLHSENSVVTTLFGMLFWDILFDDSVPGVFASPFQDSPLDFNTEFFYAARRIRIDARLANLDLGVFDETDWQPGLKLELKQSDAEDSSTFSNDIKPDCISGDENIPSFPSVHDSKHTPLHVAIISHIDATHRKKATQCRGVHWNAFTRPEILEIARCFTGHQISTICRAFIDSYGGHSGGVPDLCVWNAESNEVRLVEVKGEGDTLSASQIMWIDLMVGCGICVELFHVQLPESVGKKRKTCK
ncbi:Fanconi-associated nuclease 1 [Chytriomyces hyalinus]|nr:Fanconi-associated nuclease 1 [Chytriomyces hyalinus]